MSDECPHVWSEDSETLAEEYEVPTKGPFVIYGYRCPACGFETVTMTDDPPNRPDTPEQRRADLAEIERQATEQRERGMI